MTNVSTRITEEERAALEKIAAEREVTLSWVVRKAIREFIKNNQED